jgi:prepilin-type N-terminal cleavage/methylation domain-containing protein
MVRKQRVRDDSGMTLVELLVSMLIFSILMAITTAVMINLLYMTRDNLGRVDAAQEARLGISQIDRQVRSGNVIMDPASESMVGSGVAPYYSLRIYTQEGNAPKCAQWRVIADSPSELGRLEYRYWSPNYPTDPAVADWAVVARNVVVPTATTPDPDDPATWPPFWKDPTTVVGGASSTPAQNVRITLKLKSPEMREDAKPVSISTVVTGRNTVLGYSESNCSIIPPA